MTAYLLTLLLLQAPTPALDPNSDPDRLPDIESQPGAPTGTVPRKPRKRTATVTPEVAAPSRPAVTGRVVDLIRGTTVAGAKVTVVETGATTTSNRQGIFEFATLPPGTATLRASSPRFEALDTPVTIGPDGHVSELVEIGIFDQIESVSVTTIVPRERPAPGGAQISREEITVVPGSRGDVLSAVQSLPGMAQTGTFNLAGGLVIRGSAPSDSRVFVDGVEVPIIFHFFNLQSILPSEMIDDVIYAPGGFGVEYGRASGGVVEVLTRRPKSQYHGTAEMSFINAGGFVQGPLLGPNHAGRYDPVFALGFRRSFIDALLPLALKGNKDLSFTALPRYYDYQARVDWQITDGWRLGFFLFGIDDLFKLTSNADSAADPSLTGSTFVNETAFLRAITSATYESERVFSRTTASGMHGRFIFEAGPDRYLRFDGPGAALRNETRIHVTPRLLVRTGGEAERWWFNSHVKFPRPPREGDPQNPNFSFDKPIEFNEEASALTYLSLWLMGDVDVTRRLTIGAGLRYDGFLRSYDHVLQPRGSAKLKLTDRLLLRAAGGLYTRPPDFNDEFSQRSLDPEKAWQTTMGLEHKLREGLTLQATGFYTWRTNLIGWKTNRNDPGAGLDAYDNRGVGKTYGGELFVRARTERSFGWLAYTLSRSLRRDDPGSPERLFDFDQTHSLILVGSRTFKDGKWRLGGRFQYTTGKPTTPVTGSVFQSDLGYYQPEYGKVNSRRYEAQHQLDVRVDRIWKFQHWTLSAYLDVTNIYMHPAPLQAQYTYDYTKDQSIKNVPILPALGVRGEL